MPSKPLTLFPSEAQLLIKLGERLKMARLRRKLSTATVATRAHISRMTLYRVEEGSPAVGIGVYLRVLVVLGLENDMELVAADDKLGRKLQDLELPTKQRARKS